MMMIDRYTIDFIRLDVKQATLSLQQQESSSSVALLHRSEIITGRRLGSGRNNTVYEVTGIRQLNQHHQDLTPDQQRARQELAAAAANNNNRRFALKQLSRHRQGRQDDFLTSAADLVIEGEYLSRIIKHHDNLCTLRALPLDGIDAFAQKDGGYFLLLDRVDSCLLLPTTTTTTCSNNSSSTDALQMALDVARGLQHLHNHKHQAIVYRDLKPDNLGMMKEDGRVVLFDFGVCRQLPAAAAGNCTDSTYMSSCCVGTPRYMAPEVALEQPYNAKADVYSWALVTWELLSGCKPYANLSSSSGWHFFIRQVCQEGVRPPLAPAWPEPIHELLQACWTANVAKRWDMNQVVGFLEDYLEAAELKKATTPLYSSKPNPPVSLLPSLQMASDDEGSSSEDDDADDSSSSSCPIVRFST